MGRNCNTLTEEVLPVVLATQLYNLRCICRKIELRLLRFAPSDPNLLLHPPDDVLLTLPTPTGNMLATYETQFVVGEQVQLRNTTMTVLRELSGRHASSGRELDL